MKKTVFTLVRVFTGLKANFSTLSNIIYLAYYLLTYLRSQFVGDTYKYYRYDNHSYLIEFDSGNQPKSCAILIDGEWLPVDFDCHTITANNAPVTEEEAYHLAGREKGI